MAIALEDRSNTDETGLLEEEPPTILMWRRGGLEETGRKLMRQVGGNQPWIGRATTVKGLIR